MPKKTARTKIKSKKDENTMRVPAVNQSRDVASFNETSTSPIASSSPSQAKQSPDDLIYLKNDCRAQLESEYVRLNRIVDHIFDKAADEVMKRGLANTIVTSADFPPGSLFPDALRDLLMKEKKSTLTASSHTQQTSDTCLEGSRGRRRSHSETREHDDDSKNGTIKRLRSSSCSRSNRFQTPCGRPRDDSSMLKIATVTPLIKNHIMAPPSILRKPMPGETAISLSGSPLHVTSDNVIAPSLTVPLNDGRVLNLQRGAAASEFRLPAALDRNVLECLHDIKNYLNNALS